MVYASARNLNLEGKLSPRLMHSCMAVGSAWGRSAYKSNSSREGCLTMHQPEQLGVQPEHCGVHVLATLPTLNDCCNSQL